MWNRTTDQQKESRIISKKKKKNENIIIGNDQNNHPISPVGVKQQVELSGQESEAQPFTTLFCNSKFDPSPFRSRSSPLFRSSAKPTKNCIPRIKRNAKWTQNDIFFFFCVFLMTHFVSKQTMMAKSIGN
jgi:hypothetical protein